MHRPAVISFKGENSNLETAEEEANEAFHTWLDTQVYDVVTVTPQLVMHGNTFVFYIHVVYKREH